MTNSAGQLPAATTDQTDDWVEEGTSAEIEAQIDEYDLTSSPNDFNVATIVDFIQSGAVKIPGFQRNFVWDIKRASKLVESLIIGLPVPQVFLYEEAKNRFLVIDGQQRLMSIYYFVMGRFPRKDKRVQLRRLFDEHGSLPEFVLGDDEYFENFNLQLPRITDALPNKFHRLNYQTLGDYQTSLKLRTIRNVIVKQVRPSDDDSSIYEMFNRLNTGGVLLTPQEIRSSLYHSPFYDELTRLNLEPEWRDLLGRPEPDLHMRDVEVLLRAVALWREVDTYAPSMVKFLNVFSKRARHYDQDSVDAIAARFRLFLQAASGVPRSAFLTRQGRFSMPLFESVFSAAAHALESDPAWKLRPELVAAVSADDRFIGFSQEQTTDTINVKGRLSVARKILS